MALYYTCDLCGKQIAKDDLRYTVKIDVRAAYDTLEISLADLLTDHRKEIEALIEQIEGMDPQKLQDEIYKGFQFDVCRKCQKRYLKDPMRGGADVSEELHFDVDEFLKRLGEESQ